jgi:hypothetical protein
VTYTGCVENDETGYGQCIATIYVPNCIYNSYGNCVGPSGDYRVDNSWVKPWGSYPACPVPTVHPEVPYSYDDATKKCVRPEQVSICPVPDLRDVKDIPPNDPDVLPLTLELEQTRGAGLALLPAAQAGVDCIKRKESGAVITSGTRTLAYQAHLKEIWDKSVILNKQKDPAIRKACQPLRDKINTEKGCPDGHCIVSPPATNSNHPKGTAFDVSRVTINGLLLRLAPLLPPNPPLTPQQQVQADIKLIADWLATPASCNLVWGGGFQPIDEVHFQIP